MRNIVQPHSRKIADSDHQGLTGVLFQVVSSKPDSNTEPKHSSFFIFRGLLLLSRLMLMHKESNRQCFLPPS
jgi:hypothetical protein